VAVFSGASTVRQLFEPRLMAFSSARAPLRMLDIAWSPTTAPCWERCTRAPDLTPSAGLLCGFWSIFLGPTHPKGRDRVAAAKYDGSKKRVVQADDRKY
jgi:hypothetical protein